MDKQITINLDAETYQGVRELAREQGNRSVSSIVREMLAKELLERNGSAVTRPAQLQEVQQ
jgi:hypothetical protein